MKTLIHSVQVVRQSHASPLNGAALPLFFSLAFLPCILRLLSPQMPVTNPFAAAGCVLAGFWLAGSLNETRVNSVLLGSLVATLLWSANWLMLAGGACCSTIN